MAPDTHSWAVTLDHPPGVNRLWRYARIGAGVRVYKTVAAREWENEAMLALRAAGVRALPPGAWWLALSCALHTCRLDADAPLKIVLDVVAAALAVDDRHVGSLAAQKIPVHHRGDQRLELRLSAYPLADAGAFADLSRRAAAIVAESGAVLLGVQ